MHRLFVSSVFVFSVLFQSSPAKAQHKLFKLLNAKETGITFTNEINETEDLNVLAYEYFYNGGGVAVGDINNDGLPDLFFTANMKPNRLFLNLGNMKFKDITKQACPEMEGRKNGWKTGVTMADVNGDGLLDIYVCYSGKVDDDTRRNQLFINKGNLHFEEEAKKYGLDDKSYSTQAVFFDYDNDGDLDMFLLNHSTKKIDNLELAKYRNVVDTLAGCKLYRNDGNGHFTDVSKQAGIHQNPLTFGLGVTVSDINKDGWPDIYVTNDYNEPDFIYINNGNGTFSDKTADYFQHLAQFSMGVDIADYNNDGLPDVMNLDMLPEDNRRQKQLQLQENYESFQLMVDQDLQKQYMHNMLQLNNGDGTFSEIAQVAGVSNTDWSWSPLLADFDNDGYKDLFISNGYLRDYTNKDFLRYWGDYKIKKAMDRQPVLMMDLVRAMPSTLLPNYIFKNNHDLTFTNEVNSWGLNQPSVSSGAAYADLDNDGDLDLVVNNINEPAFVYQNLSRDSDRTNYISIKLKGKAPNTFAIGSKVYIYSGASIQYQEVYPTRGYLSCMQTRLHFGLGSAQIVDSIRVIFPDASTLIMTGEKANQLLTIDQNDAHAKFDYALKKPVKKYFSKDSTLLKYSHAQSDENDFKRQSLMLFMYSKTGPVMTSADVNKDGLQDLFISGDANQPGKIYLQQKDGTFKPENDLSIGDENTSTISAATFFDANDDGFPDLYVAKGGYSLYNPNTPALQDELYLNDGKGRLVPAQNSLPDVTESAKSCVRACDYDNDGKVDLFVGGRIIPGQYPVTPRTYLLKNTGKSRFTIEKTIFDSIGMVTDAQWVDLNGDGRKDLVLCGEFMPIKVFINLPTGFRDETASYFPDENNGFWNTLTIADVNNDGHPDIIAGNLGLNSQLHCKPGEPGVMYYADFDGNGNIDPIFTCYVEGKSYPYVSRDELNNQMFSMRRKFTSYRNYADATITDILSPAQMKIADSLVVNELHTCVFIFENGRFVKKDLPVHAQFTYVSRIIANDFDKDGNTDLLLLGNHSDNRLKLGSIDAGYGILLKGDGKGNFRYVPQTLSGMCIKGDVKSALMLDVKQQPYILAGVSSGELQVYKVDQRP